MKKYLLIMLLLGAANCLFSQQTQVKDPQNVAYYIEPGTPARAAEFEKMNAEKREQMEKSQQADGKRLQEQHKPQPTPATEPLPPPVTMPQADTEAPVKTTSSNGPLPINQIAPDELTAPINPK